MISKAPVLFGVVAFVVQPFLSSANECEHLENKSEGTCNDYAPSDPYCFCSWFDGQCMMACAEAPRDKTGKKESTPKGGSKAGNIAKKGGGKASMTPCKGAGAPVGATFCGRGGSECSAQEYCDIHPTDKWAVCCPAQASCFQENTKYNPVDMEGVEKTGEAGPLECQARCRSTSGCQHFSYWPSGGCHLQDSAALAVPMANKRVVAGPPFCKAGKPGEEKTPSKGGKSKKKSKKGKTKKTPGTPSKKKKSKKTGKHMSAKKQQKQKQKKTTKGQTASGKDKKTGGRKLQTDFFFL